MLRPIKIIVTLIFITFCFTDNYAIAQEETQTYQSVMASGDNEFANKNYIKAKTCYQEALRLKPDDANAKKKLDKTLQAIREESRKEEKFFEHIDKADEYHKNGELGNALVEYNNALNIKSDDEYALNQKAIISKTLQDEKEKLDAFDAKIALGDKLLKEEKLAEAVMQYESALKLYPNNNTAKAKLKEAKDKNDAYNLKVSEYERFKALGHEYELRKKYSDAIGYYQQSLDIFPEDIEIPAIISSLQSKKNIADSYEAKIREADALYEDQSYDEAKLAYQAALAVIPDDSYSQGMIARIDEIVNSADYLNIQKAKAKLDNDFAALISKGANAEGFGNFELAISYYDQALELKPGNHEAVSKKEEAQRSLLHQQQLAKEQERLAAIEAEKQRKATIQNMIGTGNQQLADKKYAESEQTFNELLAFDPNNATALAQLKVIEGFYEEIQLQKAENYRIAMNAGSLAMTADNFQEALKQFNIALANKPGDETASQQLAAAQQLEDLRLSALQNEYNSFIAKADAQFQGKNYDKAIDFYTKAINLNTGNSYPSDKVKEINEILIANKLANLLSEPTSITSNQTQRFTFEPIDVTTRRNNYLLIKARNLGTERHTMYVSFGSANGKNGGFTVSVPENQDINDFIIRIGSQYKWFSEDNTWIEISPENGDIEVISMEISKSN